MELNAALTENRRLLSKLSATEHEVQNQNKWIGEAVNLLDVQKMALKHIEVSIVFYIL